jgi:structural maintenance of chromosome 2
MHVKEISLDGFKSYAQRVVIPGFDSQFNAITGLNGSGKSNILDSICFVLGISNLQQVGLLKFIAESFIIYDHNHTCDPSNL